ncbi:RDD family protein [Crocosphaera watsonii]|uniref:COG1714: Predicted membrane protein/domain n=1 Tax=Crocosphaera watsonii WH 8502 TaxID=423474 RepID=T2IKL7_CROWT|nr:RDD family protein [Crocosphaera watsonii]CCQ52735.1 COG1714: Predicted membrane protein/domain [Crocosphaera watsonii WH 8502]
MDFFNQFKIETPESVELEFTLAGIGNSVYAFVIDMIVLGLIITILLIIAAFFLFNIPIISSLFGIEEEQVSLWILAIQFFIIFATYVGYFVLFETLWQGETPGKRFVKIRVIQDNGRPITLQQATLRALFRPVDDLFFLGLLFVILGKREKRIGDWVAGTLIIQEAKGKKGTDLTVSQEAENLTKYLQNNTDLSRLLPEDFATLRRYLQRRDEMFTEARMELARKLAYQVKDIIGLQEIPEGTTSNLFLEAVYLAYQKQV